MLRSAPDLSAELQKLFGVCQDIRRDADIIKSKAMMFPLAKEDEDDEDKDKKDFRL
ncbi:MAG: hypothetical protein LE169_02900 [Endomicrobium sp.]|nr:hypothetical protein [Endomicrobium sp.]